LSSSPAAPRIAAIDFRVLHVSAKTNWSFVRVRTEDGLSGVGEASLNGYEPMLAAYLDLLRPGLEGAEPDDALPALATYSHAPAGLVANAVRSAVRQAFVDVRAKAIGVPAWQLLGGRRRDRVPVYANVNRATTDRSPAGCAARARAAVEQGFRGVKIAPFDGVLPDALADPATLRAIDAGVERVRAMREAVGPDVRLMVDCHWRFDQPTALLVLDRLAAIGVQWFECPVSEQPRARDALARIREAAQVRGIVVAACELQTGVDGFRPFVRPRCVDAIMPDVKYCGGPFEMLRIAEYAHAHSVAFSPHNPTGPVCTMASLHVSLAAVAVESLELQIGESDLSRDLVHGVEPAFAGNAFAAPQAPGWGVDLDEAVLDAHPYCPVPTGFDECLG
jgi:galactonate dehydratase